MTTRRTLRRPLLAVALALGPVLAMPGAAVAQTDEVRAGARAAATEGLQSFTAGRWTDAIDRFSRAESLVHAPPHLLYIARAEQKLGHLVRAREVYLKLARESLASSAPRPFVAAVNDGAAELAALEALLPTLLISVPSAPPDTVVEMDGAAVPSALLGIARPVDPGDHTLRAKSPGAASDLATVHIAPGAHEAFTLVLHATAQAPSPVPPPVAKPPATASAKAVEPSPPKIEPDADHTVSGATVVGIASVAGGAAVAGLGAYFAVNSHSARTQGDQLCPGGQCPESAAGEINSLNSRATNDGRAAVACFALGGAAAVTGAVLILLGGHDKAATGAATIFPWIGPRGVGVTGAF